MITMPGSLEVPAGRGRNSNGTPARLPRASSRRAYAAPQRDDSSDDGEEPPEADGSDVDMDVDEGEEEQVCCLRMFSSALFVTPPFHPFPASQRCFAWWTPQLTLCARVTVDFCMRRDLEWLSFLNPSSQRGFALSWCCALAFPAAWGAFREGKGSCVVFAERGE